MARRAVKRRIYVRGGARENEGIQISDLCGELIGRKLERHVDGPSLGGDDGVVHVLRSILAEADLIMAVDGYPTRADLTPDSLRQIR